MVSNNLTVVGTMVQYSCNSQKYKLIGPNKIICLPNGEYDDNPPICKGMKYLVWKKSDPIYYCALNKFTLNEESKNKMNVLLTYF
jgi:hypothetical protein